jgi:hypothetical protein
MRFCTKSRKYSIAALRLPRAGTYNIAAATVLRPKGDDNRPRDGRDSTPLTVATVIE